MYCKSSTLKIVLVLMFCTAIFPLVSHAQKSVKQSGRLEKFSSQDVNQSRWNRKPHVDLQTDLISTIKLPGLRLQNEKQRKSLSGFFPASTLHTKSGAGVTRKVSAKAARKTAALDDGSILYVNKVFDVEPDSPWGTTPFSELADALIFAKDHPEVKQIWVTYGVYRPMYRADNFANDDSQDRENAFVLVENVKIYGGFAGYETSLEERTLLGDAGDQILTSEIGGIYATILTGDFAGDDDNFANNGENALHVVVGAGVTGAGLDGLTIAGGHADLDKTLTVNAQTIRQDHGAGITLYGSTVDLSNVFLYQNKAKSGSALYAQMSEAVVTNVVVASNSTVQTGTMAFSSSNAVITNATVTGNMSGDNAAGLYFTGAATSAKIRNSIVYGNTSVADPNISIAGDAHAETYASLVQGSGGSLAWNESFGEDHGGNLDTDPKFADATNGLYGLKPASPAINAGDNSYFDSGQMPDLSAITGDVRAGARIQKGTIDMGAFESLYNGGLSTDLVGTDGRLYVKKGGAGTQDGSSWLNAAAELSDALFAAKINDQIKEIWAGAGTYLPKYRPDDLSADDPTSILNSFLMVEGVKVYGGFAGTEQTLAQRDLSIKANESILSGDFNGDDAFVFWDAVDVGPDATQESAENALHVVYSVATGEDSELDGFTVSGGNSLFAGLLEGDEIIETALLINESSVPVIIGGPVVSLGSSLKLSNMTLKNNLSYFGAAVFAYGSDLQLTNSVVYNNLSFIYGSGISSIISKTVLVNNTIAENFSMFNGTGVLSLGTITQISNTVVFANLMGGSGTFDFLVDDYYEDSFVKNSFIGQSGGSDSWAYDGLIDDAGGNLDGDPMFKNADAKDFSLSPCSDAINKGSNDFYDGTMLPDLSSVSRDIVGNPRIHMQLVDMGAFESQSDQLISGTKLAENATESDHFFEDNNPYTFVDITSDCITELFTMTPTGLTGQVSAKVWRDNQVKYYNGAPYIQRHYDIEPLANPSTSTARLTLYFTQAEFDALNEVVTSSQKLPTGDASGEDQRKANFRIFQFHGASDDGSGDPSSYGPDKTTIDPEDEDIVWNSELERWEISFDVSGFSGFFAGTQEQSPLPVRLVSFEGRLTDHNRVNLQWKVAEQSDISMYVIEYSATSKSFTAIGQVQANDLSSTAYTFIDSTLRSNAHAYFRLRIVEKDGGTAYSRMVSVKLNAMGQLAAYPVPSKNTIYINWNEYQGTDVNLVDISGRLIRVIKKTQQIQNVDISTLPSGMFMLKPQGCSALKLVKE